MRAAPPLRCVGIRGLGMSPFEKAETAARCGFTEASSRGRMQTKREENPPKLMVASRSRAPGVEPGAGQLRRTGPRPGRSSTLRRKGRIFLILQTLKTPVKDGRESREPRVLVETISPGHKDIGPPRNRLDPRL
jgi:hypothetical protein